MELVWEHEFKAEISAAIGVTRYARETLVLGDKRGFLICVDVEGDAPVWAVGHGHRDAVLSLAFDPIHDRFASTGRDRLIQVWSAAAQELVPAAPEGVTANEVLAFFDDPPVLENAKPEEASEVTVDDVMGFFSVAYDNENDDAEADPKPKAVSVAPPVLAVVATFSGVEGWPIAAQFSHDGLRLATGGMDNAVYLWDLVEFAPIASQFSHFGWVVDLEFSPDDRLLVSASWDNSVGLFNALDLTPQVALQGHGDYVSDLMFVGDDLVSASYDKTLGVWDWKGPSLKRLIRKHTDWVQAVGPWEDGCVTISSDGTSRFWTKDWECKLVVGESLSAGFELGAPVEFSEWVTAGQLTARPEAEAYSPAPRFRDLRSTGFNEQVNRGAMALLDSALTPSKSQVPAPTRAPVNTGEFAAVPMPKPAAEARPDAPLQGAAHPVKLNLAALTLAKPKGLALPPPDAVASKAPEVAAEPVMAPNPEPKPVVPTPEPVAEQAPAPTAEPEPAPAVEPEPTPAAEPESAPAVEPEPAPAVEPEPAPAPEPVAEQGPAPEPEPQPMPAMEPEPAPQPEPTPEVEPERAPEAVQADVAHEPEHDVSDDSLRSTAGHACGRLRAKRLMQRSCVPLAAPVAAEAIPTVAKRPEILDDEDAEELAQSLEQAVNESSFHARSTPLGVRFRFDEVATFTVLKPFERIKT
ncbi:MAG: hypothetical protein R3E66_11450 [bacterium]